MAASKTIYQVVERDLMEDIVISEWHFWYNDFEMNFGIYWFCLTNLMTRIP